MKKRYLEAGEISTTHGVRGEVRIRPWADSAEFLKGFSVGGCGLRGGLLRRGKAFRDKGLHGWGP